MKGGSAGTGLGDGRGGSISSCAVGINLLDLQWRDPLDSDHTPEAFLVSSDETKSLKSHFGLVIHLICMEELVGWHPFGESTNEFPEVLVVLVCVSVRRGQISLLGLPFNDSWLIDFSRWGPCKCSCNQLCKVIITVCVCLLQSVTYFALLL